MDDQISQKTARAKLATIATGQRWVTMLQRGTLELEYYEPLANDPQQPHTRDEVYFVIAGSGWFLRDGQRQKFGPSEVIYVEAGVPHHFEEFTPDFATWAIFLGEPGKTAKKAPKKAAQKIPKKKVTKKKPAKKRSA